MVVTFDEALAKIRAETDDAVDINRKGSTVRKTARGAAFEKLMLDYFKRDSIYSDEFTDIKLWYDWYHEPDTGIDIVARDKRGNLVGIQCKCWADDSSIDLKGISTMFTVKDRKKMDRLILVYTGGTLTTHAQKTCEESKVAVLMQSDLRKSSFDWSRKRVKPKPKPLYDHQKEAIRKAVAGLKNADRGKLIMGVWHGQDAHRSPHSRTDRRQGRACTIFGAVAIPHTSGNEGVGRPPHHTTPVHGGVLRQFGRKRRTGIDNRDSNTTVHERAGHQKRAG